MTHKLKQLIQILLISFVIIFFFGFNLAHSNNGCNSYNDESLKLSNQNYPSLIEIETPDTRKWFIKTLKSVGERRVNKFYKKYQKAKFKITYPNNLICAYEGKIRIHGGRVDHIDIEKFNSSMRVVLEDGHINNKYNFALIKQNTISFDNEIFASTFFEKMGYLSGLNYKIPVIINGSEVENFLFREIPTLEMAKDSKRNNGIFLQSNKNNFAKQKTQVPYSRSIVLNRIKNSDGIAKNNVSTILYALDKLNYLYLNSLGIGNGKKCCGDNLNESNSLIKQHYNEGTYSLNFSIFDDETEIEKNSIFNLLMNAVNSTHGLAMEDRGFYYDPTFDRFEPFYRDGDANIIKQNNFDKELVQLFDFEKKYINKTIKMINDIDTENFKKILSKKGLELDKSSLTTIFDNIITNINNIKDLKLYENHENKFTKNYFVNHFDKGLNFNLAFGGLNNKFEICDIKLKDCKYLIFTNEEKNILLEDKWLTLENFIEPILYVRLSKQDYINNSKPQKRGLKKFKTFKVNNDFVIYFDSPDKSILLDRDKNEILLNQNEISNKFIFSGNNIKNWKIKFNGVDENLKDITPFKRDKNMIGGCVTIINSKFENLSIEILNNTCSKGIEILNSQGSFQDIIITKSILDAFDAEFSKISINKILVQGAKGECIGLKRGEYQINGAILNDCLDHSISVGEHATFEGKKIFANNNASGKYGNARYHKRVGLKGIMAKDSSKIILHEYKNISSRKCLLSIRKKDYYDGALVKVKKDKFSCEVADGLSKDKYSIIEFF